MKAKLDRIRGSLVGGAIGDELGFPVEFMYSIESIRGRYGDEGITRFRRGGCVSDDTQMTLFTACGLLNAKKQGRNYVEAITAAYLEWLKTQIEIPLGSECECWIARLPELNCRRAPGNTCISALIALLNGEEPHNTSFGCGGVMRTAPVALVSFLDIMEADRLAADAAEITHKHPLGWLPSALEAHVIYRLVRDENPTVENFIAYIEEGYRALEMLYPAMGEYIADLKSLTDKAVALAGSPGDDVSNIESIGEGWIGNEALAMAIYCVVKYFDNFEKAVIVAVNHQGDSDSVGAVTGNILGSAIGYDALPEHFKNNVELLDVILKVADDIEDC